MTRESEPRPQPGLRCRTRSLMAACRRFSDRDGPEEPIKRREGFVWTVLLKCLCVLMVPMQSI